MCRSIEEMLNKEKERIARRMIELNKNPLEEIAECTGLKVDEIKKLALEIRGKQ